MHLPFVRMVKLVFLPIFVFWLFPFCWSLCHQFFFLLVAIISFPLCFSMLFFKSLYGCINAIFNAGKSSSSFFSWHTVYQHHLCLFVAASYQTRLDTWSKARRPIKVGIKGRERSGTSRDSNPAGLCCSSAHLVQCEPDEASSFTNPNVGPGTYALSTSSLGCKALSIVISFLRVDLGKEKKDTF